MDLTDTQWALVEPYLKGPKKWRPGGPGRPPLSSRSVVEGILWVMRTGAPWRDNPRQYRSSSTCYRRFEQWRRDGALQRLLAFLRGNLNGGTDEAFIDGTYILAKSGGSCVGRSRGGTTTKLMAIADGFGLPHSVCLAEGNRHDVTLVDQCLDAAVAENIAPLLIGDRAFDSKPLAERLRQRGIELVAPRRGGPRPTTRKQDGRKLRRYRKRWKVERLFAWLKRYRRICVRWERKAANFLAFVHLGCIVILLRHL